MQTTATRRSDDGDKTLVAGGASRRGDDGGDELRPVDDGDDDMARDH
jgi:hypothetical protein